ncbi:Histone-lysine N-methyltransferase SETMAR [Eumeta japonica]|uniref:Histone-lysine N-methyltransferase SETMAR n=1 Tax=Eumeta variegata TaxID=151549 RepID=A0A4C1ZVZ7_EUMVA|nr:Histone-lysine N-methyltransferase SETMAR [Eumeta japonica]
MCIVGWKGIIHYELLPPDETINLNLYIHQRMELMQEVEEKGLEFINRNGVIFHHDNARPRTSLATEQVLKKIGWEELIHPPYSRNFAPVDFQLLRSLQNSLGSVRNGEEKEGGSGSVEPAHRAIRKPYRAADLRN